jgi:predicted house-cleaning noncanonical NTP pyrophosphatase (MazG superfamily)
MLKLVRDKIPEIMKLKGQHPKTQKIKSNSEFLKFLQKKLLEEVEEFIEASIIKNSKASKEELADILEVIDTICKLKKYDLNSIYKLKDKKRLEKGGFNNKILLKTKGC